MSDTNSPEKPSAGEPPPLEIAVDKNGVIVVNGKVVTMGELTRELQRITCPPDAE